MRKLDGVEQLRDPRPAVVGKPVQPRLEAQVLLGAEVSVEQRAMPEVADPTAQLPGLAGERAAERADLPGRRPQQRRKDSQQGRLAGSIRPDHGERLADRKLERYVDQDPVLAVCPMQAGRAQGGRGGGACQWVRVDRRSLGRYVAAMAETTYCIRCGTELEPGAAQPPDPPRLSCPACGYTHYENPIPTVQAWIERDGAYLMLRRAQEPLFGEWNAPGGFVEQGESGPEAIAREVREETGLEIEVLGLIGIFPSTYGSGEEAEPILDIAYRCRELGGEWALSDESSEAEWFPLGDLPVPAFEGERSALAALRGR